MKKLAFVLGISIAIFVSANFADAVQIIDDALQVNSLRVGQQGVGGVTYFNGTIVNSTTGDGDTDNPVTFGDNVRIDGRLYRGATAGSGDSQPFIINDNLEVVGSLTVGSTNVLSSISNLQSQINSKGVGDMLKSTYDVGNNGLIDSDNLDSGIAAALIGTGTVTNTVFDYLTGLSLNDDTNMHLTALGINAGDSLQTTGTNNTLLGYQAGKALTTGDESVAIGSGAMALATDATRNIIIGYNAFGANTSAPDNVVIGHSAMAVGTGNANSNVAIGNYAMNKQSGGVQNVAIGYEALYTGTNQSFNVGIGYQALKLATGGGGFGDSGNIAIGFKAGDEITDGQKNLIIGYDVDAASATDDYQLNIGDAITGDLSTGLITFSEKKDIYNITTAENRPAIDYSGSVYTNKGATNNVNIILPEASTAIGIYYTFIDMDTGFFFDISPEASDFITAETNVVADSIRSSAAYSSITLFAVDDTNWIVTEWSGTWTDIN